MADNTAFLWDSLLAKVNVYSSRLFCRTNVFLEIFMMKNQRVSCFTKNKQKNPKNNKFHKEKYRDYRISKLSSRTNQCQEYTDQMYKFHEEKNQHATSFMKKKQNYSKFLECINQETLSCTNKLPKEIINMQQVSRTKISMSHISRTKTIIQHASRRKISW